MDATAGISLIAGLGNPGAEYATTRHNVGFWALDALAARYAGAFRGSKFDADVCDVRIEGRRCRLLKPNTYMNASGDSVAAAMNFFRIPLAELLIVHDELDLPIGRVRLKVGGGHGGHNGIRDIIRALGGADFVRLRIGVGRPGRGRDVVGFLLNAPPDEERQALKEQVLRAVDVVPDIVAGRYAAAMNVLHRDPETDGGPAPA
jgi:PTH1 family peptidyl-tRNA hydrolase